MIEIFEGRLGGGKTYSAVARILAHLGKGGHVMTNVELTWKGCQDYCRKHYKVEIEEEQIVRFQMHEIETVHLRLVAGTKECPVLVVLDEAQLWFNARDWAKTNRDFLVFLTQSRKVSVDFIFISQSANNIDKQFMRLVQYIWRFKDMQRLKIPIFGIMWPLPQIYAGQYDYDGRTLLFGEWIWKSKEVFASYNTNALLKPVHFAGGTVERKELKKSQKTRERSKFLEALKVRSLVAPRPWRQQHLVVRLAVWFVALQVVWFVTLLKLKYNL